MVGNQGDDYPEINFQVSYKGKKVGSKTLSVSHFLNSEAFIINRSKQAENKGI